MEKVPLCPLRKSIKEVPGEKPYQIEMFQACLKENCAWYDEENKCAIKSLPLIAEKIATIADHGLSVATFQL